MIKIDSITKALILTFCAYAFLFLISYSTFLQVPVFQGKPLVWQSLIEQSISWIPFAFGFGYLFKTLLNIPKISKLIINEVNLLIPSLFLVLLMGMSIGVHFSSQIIEDALITQKDLFVYQLAYFLDEQVGHLFIIPGILLYQILAVLELNRVKPRLTASNIWAVNILATFTASATSILSVEAGIIYLLSLPILLISYFKLIKLAKKNQIRLLDYPLNRYLIIVMTITTIFSLIWWLVNGFSQPEELGLKLLSF